MAWMVACGTKLLWFLLLSSSPCFGSELDAQCLKTFKQSVIDPRGILASSWKVFGRHNGFDNYICSFTGVECWSPMDDRVLSLRLSNMGLGGQFPQGLEYCTSLVSLDLSSNNFSGPIPSDIARLLPYLSSLDLSYNLFSGEIPLGISDMVYLNVLFLQRNQLNDNLLSGPIPSALEKYPASAFAGNRELCNAPLVECHGETKRRLIIHDESIIGAVVGFVVGFVAAFNLAHFFSHMIR
ncbi:unnamed protein product [Urochloa decumbens]|uniref:Leucine-rich repeat-containing N-terminal plant-type domain-containing protein n=1 Tax=Urochloa decumbens TaxID=240449 RepID=A0ABC9A7J2_9POAL